MTCIIHYEGEKKYGELVSLTDKTGERVLLAKRIHESSDDGHKPQCQTIPSDELRKYKYHKEPCYKKFVRITVNTDELKSQKSDLQEPEIIKSPSSSTRSKRKVAKPQVLSTPKKKPRKQPSTSQPSCNLRSMEIITPIATSSSRNKFVFGKECAVCNKYELRYKDKDREEVREYPMLLTLDAPHAKIKELLRKKEKYKELHDKTELVNLMAAEFKYHDKCRKDLTRDHIPLKEPKGRKSTGDFTKLIDYIDTHVFEMNQALSMKTAYDIYYGLEPEEISTEAASKRRTRLKKKLEFHYGQQILILGTRQNSPDVIINSKNLDSEVTVMSDQESLIRNAAKYLRHDIIDYCDKLPPLSWPPRLEELLSDERLPPPSVSLFLTTLLKSPKHAVTGRIHRLVKSYSADFVHGVSHGQVLTDKHYLLGLGLHNITGNKKIVQITQRLGHSVTYDKVMDIEVAQAQKAVHLMKNPENSVLALQPMSDSATVPTIFWADNFDKNVDKEIGGGAINMSTMMAFQEYGDGVVDADRKISVEKKRSRNVSIESIKHNISFYDKQEPDITKFERVQKEMDGIESEFLCKLFTWLYLRFSNRFEQVFPTFPGMLLKLRLKETKEKSKKVLKTVETYLPPLSTKITDPQTIYSYLLYFQSLAKEMNMPYVNVTLDVGAAINAFKLLWKYSQQFSNVIIHLGDFHTMKENFKILGLLVHSSGFEEVVYQANVCTSGSLAGVLSGGHYNRAWRVHEIIYESLERVLFKRFINEVKPDIGDDLIDLASEEGDFISFESLRKGGPLCTKFQDYQKKVKDGHLGKTAQFWLIYIEMMRNQLQYRVSVQENDFELRLIAMESFLPLYFYYNMRNYARYVSYYIQVLKCIDKNYPGLREVLQTTGISVQGQGRYPHRTAIDMRGEQTLNRDAKTSGGVTQFASSSSSVQKWTMNRSDAAGNIQALHEMTGLSESNTVYKSLRPRQVLNSEKKVEAIVDVIENQYINPFGLQIDAENLINISSGSSLAVDTTGDVLNQVKKGKELAEKFADDRLLSSTTLFHEPIGKNDCKSFKTSSKSCEVKGKYGTSTVVEVNRNILGALTSFSLKSGIAVDFEKALQYPLSPIPLSISHPDGTQRSNQKSKLKDALLNGVESLSLEEVKDMKSTAVVVDMMGFMHTLMKIPDTYGELAKKFVSNLPKGYDRIDVVADSYKSVKLFKRGDHVNQSDKICIPSLNSRVAHDFKNILRNRENKARLIQLIFEYIKDNGLHCLHILHSKQIVLSSEDDCVTIKLCDTGFSVNPMPDLLSTQDEGDTKVILHANTILEEDQHAIVTIRSPSGDTDVVVIVVSLLQKHKERVILDDFHGDDRKSYKLSNIILDDDIIDSLIGFHAFTGNDFVSAFFRKAKQRCFTVLNKSAVFKSTFTRLGSSWDISDDTFHNLQRFVVTLYGMKKKMSVNQARYNLFWKKMKNENKTVDMCTLPPCESVLRLHCERSNFIAAIWKRAAISKPDYPEITHHGWHSDKSIIWVSAIFPDEVQTILVDKRYDPDDVDDDQGESDAEENEDEEY